MKFDKRIIDKKRIFTVFQEDEARKYIGKSGYFSNDLKKLSDLSLNEVMKLEMVNPYNPEVFSAELGFYKYFIPLDNIKMSNFDYDLDRFKKIVNEKFLESRNSERKNEDYEFYKRILNYLEKLNDKQN